MKLWWGKIIGMFFGFLVAKVPGAFIGFIIGHYFDNGLRNSLGSFVFNQQRSQHAHKLFFDTTFSIMGHIAKSDGVITKSEINAATTVMKQMQLTAKQRQQAIELFNSGKQPKFDVDTTLEKFINYCGDNEHLCQLFMDIQLKAALANGTLEDTKKHILFAIGQQLGCPPLFYRDNTQFHRNSSTAQFTLQDAYNLLDLDATATNTQVKRAYRRMMSQYHPDKMIAKGLPEEMLKIATDKTQKIQAAYEKICTARGLR